MFKVNPLSLQFEQAITDKINHKIKPLGALGQLEQVATKLALIQSQKTQQFAEQLTIDKPSLFVFAADHGIAEHGVSIAPSEVTMQMVHNFVAGGAAVSVFSKQFGWHLEIVDAGMLSIPELKNEITSQRIGYGTSDFTVGGAMTNEQAVTGLELGKELIQTRINEGADLIAFGEMGIGNTSSASAIMAAVLSLPAEQCVGAGTGIDEQQLAYKKVLIQKALDIHRLSASEPIEILAKVGGFEIAQIAGGILSAAENQVPVVIDGFICTAAAMLAKLIAPEVQDYMIFAHCSDEQGHIKMLDWFNVEPLLKLNMRLGEGSGAALSLPVIQAAMSFYNDMASFEQAQVEDVVS